MEHNLQISALEPSASLQETKPRPSTSPIKSFGKLYGNAPVIREVYRQIELVAPSNASVIILGPSGTGKEIVAQTIHQLSPRRNEPFIAINCSAIPGTLLESELFGHEKGAFTGAVRRREGSFELANHGTLFLDEIANMALDLQSKILRALENGHFRRVGGKDELHVDVRIIAASNVSFENALKEGLFREDLFYRLNVFQIHLPSLSERLEDIPILAKYFIQQFSEQNHKPIKNITKKALAQLQSYSWPGNVRELKNVIERAVIISQNEMIEVADLPETIQQKVNEGPQVSFPIGTTLQDMEKSLIEKTLAWQGGNKTETAKTLGVCLKTLHNKLKKYKA